MIMKNKNILKEIAAKKIKVLFNEADNNHSKANRYIKIARDIAMKINLSMPKNLRKKYCKYCNNYFTSKNHRVRTRNKMVVYYCFNCKKYMKFLMK